MDISAIRLKNANDLKEACNSMADFARKIGKEPTQVRHWFNPNVNKNIGNKIAREIEVAFNKPFGWMDIVSHKSEDAYLDYAAEEHKDRARHQYEQSHGELPNNYVNSSPKAQEISNAILKMSSEGNLDDSKCDAIGVLIGLGGGKASGLIKQSKGKA